MQMHEITESAGGRERRKRVGRGESSGMGKTCGRGNKGAQSRAGFYVPRLHIGGGQRTFAHMPKVGFNNFNFRVENKAINLDDLEANFDAGSTVDGKALHAKGLLESAATTFKILARGELKKKLTIIANGASDDAKVAIEKAGATLKLITRRNSAALAKTKRRTMKGKKRAASTSRLDKKNAAKAKA
ncbi:MAG: 50S ribosomal protein L15 [Phycisphaerae bacterium]